MSQESYCPACCGPMTAGRLGTVSFMTCLPCGGVWFDEGRLAAVARGGRVPLLRLQERLRSTRASVQRELPGRPHCPRCAVELADVVYPSMPGVQLQGCGRCQGFWVGYDAVGRIAQRLPEAVPAPTIPVAAPPALGSVPTGTTPRPAAPPPSPPVPAVAPVPALAVAAPASARQPATVAAAPAGARQPTAVAVREGRKCRGCGEPNGERDAVCWACGRSLRGNVPPSCPRCGGSLHALDSEGVEVGACPGCRGVWLDSGRLTALRYQPGFAQDRLIEEIRGSSRGSAVKPAGLPHCPRCKAPMFPVSIGMLTTEPIPTCPECSAQMVDAPLLEKILVG